jgi:hypothetical protein
MAFPIPTLSEARDFLIAVGKAVFPDRNYGNLKSYHSRRATFLAAAVTQLHAHIKSVQDDVMPDTAGDDGPIDRWGAILGIDRKSATPARKSQAGRVIGTSGTAVTQGEELTHEASGLRFQIATTTTVGVGGSIDADIEAIDTGSQTKLTAGPVLRFVATPAGLETSVVLQRDLDEDGYDAEPFGAYRARVLAAFSEPTAGGTQSDFVAWMLEVEGVSQAFAYPNRAGVGTVDIVALHTGSGTARELDLADQEEVLDYVAELAPAQLSATGGSLRYLDIVADEEDVELVVEPSGEAAYAFDWTGGPATVATWTAGTRTLQFTAARPSSMKAGHRISIKGVATNQDGQEFTIEALSGADSVILEEAPAIAPAATDLVYSGGPLVTPIRDAILAHMNGENVYAGRSRVPLAESSLESTVGLEVLVDGIGPANPDGIYGPWNGNLLRSLLYQIAMYKGGVRNVTIATPATDVEATDYDFPDDDQIGLIIPRRVLVRGST